MQDRIHQNYRKTLIQDYEKIESLVRTPGAAFCLSGAGPALLCITQDEKLEEKLAKKLDSITESNWTMLPLHIEFQGARVISEEELSAGDCQDRALYDPDNPVLQGRFFPYALTLFGNRKGRS